MQMRGGVEGTTEPRDDCGPMASLSPAFSKCLLCGCSVPGGGVKSGGHGKPYMGLAKPGDKGRSIMWQENDGSRDRGQSPVLNVRPH